MKNQKLTKKQSELLGAAMIEALYADASFHAIAEVFAQKYGVIINVQAFQKGLDRTVEKYNS